MPEYPNSIKRKLNEKLGELPSVKDFGAQGDGTTGDPEALQTAFETVSQRGGHLLVPQGDYRHSQTLVVPMGLRITGAYSAYAGKFGRRSGTCFTYTGPAGGTAWKVWPAEGDAYTYRVTLEHFKIGAVNRGAVGIHFRSAEECELDHLCISDGFSGPVVGFDTAILCEHLSLSSIRHCYLGNSGVGLHLAATPEYGLNNSLDIHHHNFFKLTTAGVRLGYPTSVQIRHNWAEIVAKFLLVDSDEEMAPVLTNVLVEGNHWTTHYPSILAAEGAEYAAHFVRPRSLLVQHSDPEKFVVILPLRFVQNLFYGVGDGNGTNNDYSVEILEAAGPSGGSSRLEFDRCLFWGCQKAGIYADSPPVWTRALNCDARSDWYGASVDLHEGSGYLVTQDQVTDQNQFRGLLVAGDKAQIRGNGDALGLFGTDKVYAAFYPDSGALRGYVGYPNSGSLAMLLANWASGQPLYLLADGAVKVIGKNLALGPVDFAHGITAMFKDARADTGDTSVGIQAGTGQTSSLLVFFDAAGNVLRHVTRNGDIVTAGTVAPQNTTAKLYAGANDPEGSVSAYPGSVYLRSIGGAGQALYVKESGARTNTGWKAMATAGSTDANKLQGRAMSASAPSDGQPLGWDNSGAHWAPLGRLALAQIAASVFGVGPTVFSLEATVHIADKTPATGNTKVYIQGGAGQTSPLTTWYDSAWNVLAYLALTGELVLVGPVAPQNTTAKLYSGAGDPEGSVSAYPGSVYLRSAGGAGISVYAKKSGACTTTGWKAAATAGSTDATKLQGRAVSSAAPGDGQPLGWNNGTSQWTPLAQLALTRILASAFGLGPTSFAPQATLHVQDATPATGNTTVYIQGGAGQTAALTIWYDSAWNVKAYVSKDGEFVADGPMAPQGTSAKLYSGSGAPESSVTASPGSVYLRSAGGAGVSLYVKESGSGNTGWKAIATAGSTDATKLQGRAVDSAGPTDTQSLVWDNANSRWSPAHTRNIQLSAAASSALTLTTSWQDIAGATLTLTRAGVWWISAVSSVLAMDGDGEAGIRLVTYRTGHPEEAEAQSGEVVVHTSGTGGGIKLTAAQGWIYQAASDSVVAAWQGKKLSGSSSSAVSATDTTITAVWLHP